MYVGAQQHANILLGKDLRVLHLSVQGHDPVSDLEDLSQWLGQEPELRGLVKDGTSEPGHGELGAATEVLVAAVGSGGLLTALITSLLSYRSHRRGADVAIKLTGPNGDILIDAKQVNDPEALARTALREAGLW